MYIVVRTVMVRSRDERNFDLQLPTLPMFRRFLGVPTSGFRDFKFDFRLSWSLVALDAHLTIISLSF
ncbi:hypothetical protein Y032_0144g2461 [Ancylostoma ceylanicum]|uniref:Uncharacterized protein n=1 Tax=Ancylostoma ceylanicum TaxID=53326 RepID=A0A016T310_9BILA|nr:hypothetical protein Y032_0144g2461 [Ancylostoma ceylanicum]